ncbi:MAG TPA: hypothetical protein VL485_04650 [Ktedonobacteraceae bacterium]|nr:hypothetical protein [Ktedonobacteraceae bacterium]
MPDEIVSPALFTEAANMDTFPARLTALARFAALQPLIAANPATPPTTLEQLSTSTDPGIRRAVAQNPNASVQTLCRLAGEFPQEFLHNPIIPLLSMTRPAFVKDLPLLSWASLLRFENLSRSWLQQIVTDKSYERNRSPILRLVQLHVTQAGKKPEAWRFEATHALRAYRQIGKFQQTVGYQPKATPLASIHQQAEIDIFLLLALLCPQCAPMLKEQWTNVVHTSPDRIVGALSSSLAISSKTLSLLSFERNVPVLCQVARHPRTPANVLVHLAGRRLSWEVRCAVASNPHTPLENVYRLLSDSKRVVRRAAVSHPALTQQDYEILALDQETSVRAALARVPRIGLDLLSQLARDPAPAVRAAVARNVKINVETLTTLAHDPEPVVRAAAAANSRLPGEIQSMLATDPEVAVRAGVSGNARLPESCFAVLVQDPSPLVRKQLAANSRLPVQHLETLWRTGNAEVWQGVARHPQTAPELLTQLAQQGDARVRAAVAAHRQTPLEVLYALEQENVREIWQGLAMNPNAPLDILERALATPYTDLWYRLFNHPTMLRNQRRPYLTLLASKLQQLMVANSFPNWLRKVVFQYYTSFPATIMEPFASSPHWEERYLAARHPQIAESLLDTLAHDGICYVQAGAQDALQQRKLSHNLKH